MNYTLRDYRNWLVGSGIAEEKLHAAMLEAQNAVRERLQEYIATAAGSFELFDLHFGTKEREARTCQSIESQVVAMLLKQKQQEHFAAAVLQQPGDAGMPLDD